MRALFALRASLPGSSAVAGSRRVLAVAGLTVLAFTAPAVAAYATGSVVSAATGASDAAPANETLVVRAGAPADLYPGARQDLLLRVTNESGRPVTTIAATHVATVVTNAAGTCGGTDFTVTARTPVSTVIPAGATRTLDLPDAVAMNASAGDGCQGADLRFVMTVTAT